jgi:hypothetical protein
MNRKQFKKEYRTVRMVARREGKSDVMVGNAWIYLNRQINPGTFAAIAGTYRTCSHVTGNEKSNSLLISLICGDAFPNRNSEENILARRQLVKLSRTAKRVPLP